MLWDAGWCGMRDIGWCGMRDEVTAVAGHTKPLCPRGALLLSRWCQAAHSLVPGWDGAARRSTGEGSAPAPRSPAPQHWGDPSWELAPAPRHSKGTGCACSSCTCPREKKSPLNIPHSSARAPTSELGRMQAGSLPPISAEPRRHGHPLTHCFTPPGTFYTLHSPPRRSFPLKISSGRALACSPHQNTRGRGGHSASRKPATT